MNFHVKGMNDGFAKEILLWKYEPPYNFYNNELTDEGISELMNGEYFALVSEMNHLVGFFCTGVSSQVPAGVNFGAYNDEMIDIGLGLKPELTGKGLGTSFFEFILKQIELRNNVSQPLRLTVATFNKRAIRLYESFGFTEKNKFNSNMIEFQTMVKSPDK